MSMLTIVTIQPRGWFILFWRQSFWNSQRLCSQRWPQIPDVPSTTTPSLAEAEPMSIADQLCLYYRYIF